MQEDEERGHKILCRGSRDSALNPFRMCHSGPSGCLFLLISSRVSFSLLPCVFTYPSLSGIAQTT